MAEKDSEDKSYRQKSSKSCLLTPTIDVKHDPGKKIILILIAFISGAAVMVIELAANRVLAPWFGNTLFTWTGLIGVILLALSLGYYAGGWLADRRCDYATLSHLLAVSSVTILLIPLIHLSVGKYLQNADSRLGPVLASTLLFALPGCLLGSLSPYIIRLVSLLSSDRHIGLSTGTIFMFSTLGSVIGTFGAGFFLVPQVQLDKVFVIIGSLIMALSVAGYLILDKRPGKTVPLLLLCIVNLLLLTSYASMETEKDATVIYERNNYYHRIRVYQKEVNNGDKMISLYLDTTFQGARYERSQQIPSRYQRYWALTKIFCPRLEGAAFLGAGAFTMPEALINWRPTVKVEVIEIDPQLIEVGKKFFRIDEYPQLKILIDDARRYLRLTEKRYDLIFGDVYHGVHNIPGHLLTKEFFSLVKSRLQERGVFMMNLIGAVQGKDSLLFKSTLNTINLVFRQTYVFVIEPDNLEELQNIIIVAMDDDTGISLPEIQQSNRDPIIGSLLSNYISKEKYDLSEAYLISDYYNPTEYLTARSIYWMDN